MPIDVAELDESQLRAHEFLTGGTVRTRPSEPRFDPKPRRGIRLVGVLSANWDTVQVYQRCEWTLVIGMGGAFWQGISTQEANAALEALSIERSKWPRVLDGLRVMTRAASPLLNKTKD